MTPDPPNDMPLFLSTRGRRVAVDTMPLPATPATFRSVRVSQPQPDRFTITPNTGFAPWLLLGTALVAAANLLLHGLGWALPWPPEVALILWLLCLFFAFVVGERMLRVSSFSFDRSAGQMRCRVRLSRHGRPLDDILAVQMLEGTVYSSDEGPDYTQYQLNLVLDDADMPRINVSNHPDLAWTQECGRRLADFLDVPLLEQVPDGAKNRS